MTDWIVVGIGIHDRDDADDISTRLAMESPYIRCPNWAWHTGAQVYDTMRSTSTCGSDLVVDKGGT